MATNKHPALKTTKLEGQDISEISSYKYLSLNINIDLSWHLQWDHVYENPHCAIPTKTA